MAVALDVFYINLDGHPERRRFVEAQLAAAGIEAERVSGVDGLDVPDHLRDFFFTEDGTYCDLRPGQIGCAASHLKVLGMMIERDIGAALILEDDARIQPDLADAVRDALAAVPEGWDLVRLCRPSKRAVRPIAQLRNGRRLVRFSRVPLGRAGTLMSRKGALKLLKPRHIYGSSDVEIAHPWLFDLDVYGIDPPPILQERVELPSTIGKERGGMSKLTRAMPDPRRMMFNIRKLGPEWWLRCLAVNAAQKVFSKEPQRRER